MLLAEQSEMHFFPSQLKVGEGTQAHQKTQKTFKKNKQNNNTTGYLRLYCHQTQLCHFNNYQTFHNLTRVKRNSPLLTLASVPFSGSLLLAVGRKMRAVVGNGEASSVLNHNTGRVKNQYMRFHWGVDVVWWGCVSHNNDSVTLVEL